MSARAHWVWNGESVAARTLRAGLTPPSFGLAAGTRLRASAYRRGLFRTHQLPLPSVSVGNLTVGGTGKTPVASWIAAQFAARGVFPGILLRGYGGGDEADVHRQLLPGAVVVEDPDRRRGARLARENGA